VHLTDEQREAGCIGNRDGTFVSVRVPSVKASWLACVLLLWMPASTAAAEWQFKPFFAASFAGNTTLIDVDFAAGNVHPTVGVGAVLIGEIVGVEVDFGASPGFFSADGNSSTSGNPLVRSSSVTTWTGNVVIAVPQRLTQYTLRPYLVGGGGIMHARSEGVFNPLPVASTLPALDIGGGVTGFLTRRLGLNWDVRYFRSLGGGNSDKGLSFGPERLSFWRASMALAIRR